MLLTTPTQIRQALGPDYLFIKEKFDRHREDRDKTRRVGATIGGPPSLCAICGMRFGTDRVLQWAHIIGLYECGETEPENLIPLCKPCHGLYDRAPSAAPSEMKEARQRWLNGGCSLELHRAMQERSQSFFAEATDAHGSEWSQLSRFIAGSEWNKARKLCECMIAPKIRNVRDREVRFRWILRLIKVLRGSGKVGDLEQAEIIWTQLRDADPGPLELAADLRYQGGYVQMLLGRHAVAHDLFRENVDHIELTPRTSAIWSASTGLAVQTLIAMHGRATPWDKVLNWSGKAREACAGGEGWLAREWIDNWNWHMVRIQLVRGERDLYKSAWDDAETQALTHMNRFKWDPLGFGIKRTISGMVLTELAMRATERDRLHYLQRALRHLSRAMVLKVGRPLQPEMVRDLLFSLAKCLRMLNDIERAMRVEAVALRTRDGSSWLHPYLSSVSTSGA